MLLIISFLIGKNLEEKKKQENVKQEHKEKGENFSYSSTKKASYESDLKNEQKGNENYKYNNPEIDKVAIPKEQPITLSKFFSESDIEASKKVAEAYITLYYPFNGDNPSGNVENAKQYMSDALYNSIKGQLVRPTQMVYKKELTQIDVYEPYNPTDKYITWNVRVKGNVFDTQGNQTKEETYDYSLKMVKVNENFKVDKFILNVAY